LVVDDHQELAHATAAMGARVTLMPDASAARAWLDAKDGAVDAVLSDVVLPGAEDGLALALSLRDRWPGVPVVLTTGHSTRLAAAAAAGFTVLHKPVLPAALASTLADAMRRAPPGARRLAEGAGAA
jgi:two-component system, NtrC family, sensor kinase